jgi:CHAT domain-containing protein/Tfp pilus assembly protein PilF
MMTGLRASLIALLGGLALLPGLAMPAHAGAEPSVEMRSKADAGDAFSLWQLGDFYRKRNQAGDSERSLDFFRRAAERYRASEGENGASVAIVLGDVATAASALGRHDEAIAAARGRVSVLTTSKAPPDKLADAQWTLGRTLQFAGRYQDSLQPLATARDLYAAMPDDQTRWIAGVDWDAGTSLQFLNRWDDSLEKYRSALAAYERLGEPMTIERAGVIGRMAEVHASRRDYAATLADREKQVALLRQADPSSEPTAEALVGLAQARIAVRDYDGALGLLDESQALYAAIPGHAADAEVNILMTRGAARQGLEQFERMLDLYRQSVELYAALGESQRGNLAVAHANVSRALSLLTRFAEADEEIRKSIAIYEELLPGTEYLAAAYQQQVEIDQALSRYRDALEPNAKARAIYLATQGDMSEAVGDTWLSEGISHEGMKAYDTALEDYRKARERYDRHGEQARLFAAYATNNIAWVYRRTGEYARSEALFRDVLPVLEEKLGPANLTTNKVVINIGIVSQLQGKNDEAIRWSMRALTNINRAETATLEDQRWTYDTLSKAFKGRHDPKRAILFAKLAINAQQKIRANNKSFKAEDLKDFKQEWRFLYQDLADLLIGQGRLAEAQAVLNMEKEEELSDFVQRDASADLRDSQAALTTKEDAQLADVDRLVAEPIATANAVAVLAAKRDAGSLSADEQKQLDAMQASLDDAYSGFMDDVDAFLKKADAEDVGVQKEVEAINLDYVADMQEELRRLGGKAAMLQIASLGEATHLFFTVPDASVHREVKIGREELSHMVFDALDAIERRDPAAATKMQALYRVLIEQVAGDLKASGAETLMLNLQGFLRYVPFAALYDGRRYLVEDYALALYTPAARTEFEAAARDPAKSAGFGVTASHPGFAALPGVAREIEAIFGDAGRPGALAGAASLDDKFTRDAFRAALQKRPEIVHIASHFKLVPGRETDSFLLLGDGSPLSLSDIRKGRGFRFGGVDLLTLSACETARGGDGDGDEVESFGALAQMNGASSVMATLWPVADEATAALMKSFYRHMVEEKMSKADALRAAQIEAIRGAGPDTATGDGKHERGAASLVDAKAMSAPANAGHPYFWSPFVLMGNWM